MRHCILQSLILVALLSGSALAQSAVLPYSVTLGGQKATAAATATAATIATPVDANADIAVGIKTDKDSMIIINVFATDAAGKAKAGAPEVILLRGKNTGKLSDTMSRKKLTPGHYRMSIVAGGKTALVVFQVK